MHEGITLLLTYPKPFFHAECVDARKIVEAVGSVKEGEKRGITGLCPGVSHSVPWSSFKFIM